jgi:hypothetical protein
VTKSLRLPLTVAALCLLGASPALLVEMRRPPDVPRRMPVVPAISYGTVSGDLAVPTCTIDGRTWFHARADGACHAEDAPK